jgi:hypothetical protein
MVQSKPRECVMIDGSRFCKSEPTTPKEMGSVMVGFPLGIITWVILGICVAKILEKGFNIDIDNPFVMLAGMLVPPMLVGVIILLFN